MSKVLRLLDFKDHLRYHHEEWLIEQEMKEQELADENIKDSDRFDSYVDPDGGFTHDDIPF